MTDNFSKPFRMPESVPPTPELAAQLQKLAHTVSHPMRGAGLLLEKDGSTRILTALSDERFPGSAGMPPAEISWSSFYRNLEESGERLNPETPVETAGGRRVDLSRFFEHSAPAWASKPGRNRNLWRGAILRELQSAPVSVINTWREHFRDWRPVELLETRAGTPFSFEARTVGAPYPVRTFTRPLIASLMPEVEQAPRIPFSLGKNPDFEVLYEDQDSIVILKPSGIPSVPGILEPISMKSVLEEKTGPLYTVHRLDQGTSGVLLFAKNAAAAASLSDAFASRLTRKTYTAILEGEAGIAGSVETLRLPLGGDPFDLPRQIVLSESNRGKSAKSAAEIIAVSEHLGFTRTLVRLHPETGRTHQLRIHMALGFGCPILGDALYGKRGLFELREQRLYLHLEELTFPRVSDGKPVTVRIDSGFSSLL